MQRRQSKSRVIAAIDPGLKSAAIAISSPSLELRGGQDWRVTDIPTMGIDKQVFLNGTALAAELTGCGVSYVIVERVQAMPRQGVSSTFKFGMAFGQILGVIQALEIPYELVQPAKWKREMRLSGGADKGEESRGRALELFPSLHEQLARKKDHNRAEALLLAKWWLDKRDPL